METLILQLGGRSGRARDLVRSQGETLSIGRGYANDVVLADPYVAPVQGSFRCRDDRWVYANSDDTNRVLLNGANLPAREVEVQPGDRLVLGRTEVRVFSPDTEVAPTRKLLISDWLHHDSVGLLFPLLALVACNLVDYSVDYLLQATREIDWKESVSSLLWLNLFLFGWAVIWAITGKIIRHHAHFGQQLFITAVWLIALILVLPPIDYIEFASNGALPGEVVSTLVLLAMIAWLLRFNLYFSTSGRHATAIGIAFSCIIVGGLLTVNFLSEDDFDTRAPLSSTLYPGFTLPGSGESVESYFAEVEAIVGAAE